MTTHHNPHPDDDPYRPPVDPLRPDRRRCDCGATAGRDGRCRKCRARTTWTRRNTGRRAHADRQPLAAPRAPARPLRSAMTRPATRKETSP